LTWIIGKLFEVLQRPL